MASTDSYATAKANLRDNVKTLVGIFGGIAGLLLAGTPFTGYGSLDPASATFRWSIATVGLAAAVVLVGSSIVLLLRLLQPDLVYQSVLRRQAELAPYDPADREEIEALRREFERQRGNLLPEGMEWLDDLETETDEAHDRWVEVVNLAGAPGAPADLKTQIDARRQIYEGLYDNLGAVNNWAAYTRLRYRIIKGCNLAFVMGFAALVAIGMFSWAVGQKKEETKDVPAAQIFVVQPPAALPPSPPAAPLPAVNPILFKTGQAALSTEGMAELAKARDYLRGHPDTAVLAFAYTDTRGGGAVNRALAARRAQVVRSALIAEGGIAASRIFVAELPETDLPIFTGRPVDSQSNRSVQLMLLALPQRGH
ncbi:outer membrane protein OmpA-like peptidoglycan-associated protein [Paraburkholderia sp. UCT70]|uniref:OmpA family protein n=1 Tax=Paraburkholderia sp. UCT70 TaxID=2991068 RepID=UPI003D202633